LDNWVLARLDETIIKAKKDIDNYDSSGAVAVIELFVQDLSTWYVRRSRERIGPSITDLKSKDQFYGVLYYILVTLSKMLAPFIPFMTEEIYQNLINLGEYKLSGSVHLTNWPEEQKTKQDESLLEQMKLVRRICELGNASRKEVKIKVRQPLAKIVVKSNTELDKELTQLIKDELNVKKVIYEKTKGDPAVQIDINLTPELLEEGEARDLVRKIQELRKVAGCRLDQRIIVYGPSFPKKAELRAYIQKETLAEKLLPFQNWKIE